MTYNALILLMKIEINC